MKISIIIPVYNTSKYLQECLDSVVKQSFQDWECLLINDGSTDNSGTICDTYALVDKRFRVFHIANSGVSFARNLGIENAGGEFITFIDSDDSVDIMYLSELYSAISKNESELSVCGIRSVWPSRIQELIAEEGVFKIDTAESSRFIELNRKFLLYAPYAKLYHSKLIEEVRFPTEYHFGEDLIFNFQYLEKVHSIAVVGEAYYNYKRFENGTLSSSEQSRDFTSNYKQWNIIQSFFTRKGITGAEAETFLSNRLWGIVYDIVMSSKLRMDQINNIFNDSLEKDLRIYDNYSIVIPAWLKNIILHRRIWIIWLLQRKLTLKSIK